MLAVTAMSAFKYTARRYRRSLANLLRAQRKETHCYIAVVPRLDEIL
jgi:hypothetical protein